MMHRILRCLAPLGLLAVASNCSNLAVQRYESQRFKQMRAQGQPVKRIAVTPLIAVGATQTATSLFEIGQATWIRRSTTSAAFSAAELKPAEANLLKALRPMVGPTPLVPPDDVSAALRGAAPTSEAELLSQTAAKTGSDAVLSFIVRGFNSTQGGFGRESEASAKVTAMCHDKQGELLWTLSFSYGYKISGFSSAPTLAKYVEDFMEATQSEIGAYLSPMTGHGGA